MIPSALVRSPEKCSHSGWTQAKMRKRIRCHSATLIYLHYHTIKRGTLFCQQHNRGQRLYRGTVTFVLFLLQAKCHYNPQGQFSPRPNTPLCKKAVAIAVAGGWGNVPNQRASFKHFAYHIIILLCRYKLGLIWLCLCSCVGH